MMLWKPLGAVTRLGRYGKDGSRQQLLGDRPPLVGSTGLLSAGSCAVLWKRVRTCLSGTRWVPQVNCPEWFDRAIEGVGENAAISLYSRRVGRV